MNEKAREYTIDFTNVKYYLEMHAVIRDSLGFPAYYGCNWDACWDCLTERANQPIHVRIVGLETIRQEKFDGEAEVFLDILKKFKHYRNDKYADHIQIEIINTKTGKMTAVE
ncbi:MAG: barstar family protein [Clostridia bacterium]|nr:barstar family protein [Clostridia bacterium]